jgi:anthranilate phosphoribosyltransferase
MGLRVRGETVDELTGGAQALRERMLKVQAPAGAIDTCGTGGDASGTFNVSTATAFVVAGAGLKVAKHGNRSVSSLCGSADVVETLGISIDLSPGKVARCLDEVGIGFLYAPLLHTAMKHVMVARREMGVRTVFNMLGPLTNPAGANAQLIGVYAPTLTEPLARVLAELGTIRAFVVHGADGLDEISNTGESHIAEVHEGVVRSTRVRPEDFGIPRATIAELQGGDRQENAEIIRRVLAGAPGPRRDIVLMNAAAALVAGAKARDLKEGVGLAAQSIDSGAASRKLDALGTLSQRLAGEGAA